MKILNFTLVLALIVSFLSACKLDPPIYPKKTDSTSTIDTVHTGTTADTGYYLKATLNGQALNWQVTADPGGWGTGSGGNAITANGVITGYLTAEIFASNKTLLPGFYVEFKTMQVDTGNTVTPYFNSFVNTGGWNYATIYDYDPGYKSLIIYYTDSTGKPYTSVGPQAHGTANIISATPIPGQYGAPEGLKIKLTLNCILYPADGSPGTLTLVNAEATVYLSDLLKG